MTLPSRVEHGMALNYDEVLQLEEVPSLDLIGKTVIFLDMKSYNDYSGKHINIKQGTLKGFIGVLDGYKYYECHEWQITNHKYMWTHIFPNMKSCTEFLLKLKYNPESGRFEC